MTVAAHEPSIAAFPVPTPRRRPDIWRAWCHARLTSVFEAARELPFDDDDRFIFFSDCHRGDNSRADAFAPNEELFLQVLNGYYDRGFTYVEVGDGDEMWQNRSFHDIVSAHPRTFDLLHRFDRENRLHVIVGNHDIGSRHFHQVSKDGLVAEEGLVLRYRETEQELFVVHGHQADFKSDGLSIVGRLAVRHFWRRVQLLGLRSAVHRLQSVRNSARKPSPPERRFWPRKRRGHNLMERRIISWLQAHRQIVIAGHTHRPMAPRNGAPPYFNTGSCTVPGQLTGLELQNGELRLVKWAAGPGSNNGSAPQVERRLLAPARQLRRLGFGPNGHTPRRR